MTQTLGFPLVTTCVCVCPSVANLVVSIRRPYRHLHHKVSVCDIEIVALGNHGGLIHPLTINPHVRLKSLTGRGGQQWGEVSRQTPANQILSERHATFIKCHKTNKWVM